MSSRLDLGEVTVLPFQFPALSESSPKKPETALPVADASTTEDADTSAASNNIAADDRAARLAAELAEARAEGLERGLAEGREQGYAAGFAEGTAAGEASLAEEAGRLTGIVARLRQPLADAEEAIEEAVAALALEVARCVIGAEVKRSHEFLVRLVREAIARVPLEMGAPRVLLNPADLELIHKLVPEAETGGATLVGDEAIEAGGCLVVADGEGGPIKDRRWNPRAAEGISQVDLTLPARWRAVMLALFDGEDE